MKGEQQWAFTFIKEGILLTILYIVLMANTFIKEDIPPAILYIVLESKNVYSMIDIFYYLLSSLLLYKYIDERLSIAIN